jgi:hypothetical protein
MTLSTASESLVEHGKTTAIAVKRLREDTNEQIHVSYSYGRSGLCRKKATDQTFTQNKRHLAFN